MASKGTATALLAASLITSSAAWAQGTYQGTYSSGVRNGYGTPTSSQPAAAAPASSSSTPSSGVRNPGTGQGRTEGVFGLTPQLQRELGIGRQQ